MSDVESVHEGGNAMARELYLKNRERERERERERDVGLGVP